MLQLQDLVRNFGAFQALGPLTLDIDQDRVVAVIGPSGCGKSTLLRLLAGLDTPTHGTLALDGRPIQGPRPDIGVVFQEPRLMPWLSARQNIALGVWDWPRAQATPAVDAALDQVGLTRFAHALPKQLSGGMAQRVGIARALVGRPRLLLLDEPFGALDPLTRIRMQDHLLTLVGRNVPNVLLVTHDIEEAIVLAQRILVLDGPPARVALDLAVPLPYPRTRTDSAFQDIKRTLLERLLPA